MRIATLVSAAAIAAFAMPALAQGPAAGSTLANVLEKGVTMEVGGMEFEMAYKPDGTFDGGAFAGTYKVDGNKLCITIEGLADNACTEYPDGKKSGDSFEVPSEFGVMTIKIK